MFLSNGVQNGLIKQLQEGGCYFLSIIYIAEKHNKYLAVDVLRYAAECIDKGWLKKDFTVIRPDLILGKLLGVRVDVISISTGEYNKNLEHKARVNCWYNPRTGLYHFNLDDFDSLSNSVTVREGKIVSYRLFSW